MLLYQILFIIFIVKWMPWPAEILQIICPWFFLLLISIFVLKHCFPVVRWFAKFWQRHTVVQRLVLSHPQDMKLQVYVMCGWNSSESASISATCPRASWEGTWSFSFIQNLIFLLSSLSEWFHVVACLTASNLFQFIFKKTRKHFGPTEIGRKNLKGTPSGATNIFSLAPLTL